MAALLMVENSLTRILGKTCGKLFRGSRISEKKKIKKEIKKKKYVKLF